jgi:hypothetical protein
MEEALGKLGSTGVVGAVAVLAIIGLIFCAKGWRDEARSHMETLRNSTKEMNAAAVAMAVQAEKQRASIDSLISMVKSLYRFLSRDGRTLTPGSFAAVTDEDR